MATRFLRFTVYDLKNLTDPNVTVYKLNAIMSCGLRQNKCTCSYIPTTILISHSGNRIELFFYDAFDVKLSVITVCLTVNFEQSGAKESTETRMCHRQTKALETLLPLCVFSSCCLVLVGDLPSSTQRYMNICCYALSSNLILRRHIRNGQMTRIGVTYPLYFFVFITIIDRVNIYIFIFRYVLRVSLPARDIYNIILQPPNNFTDFFNICHKQMLIFPSRIV